MNKKTLELNQEKDDLEKVGCKYEIQISYNYSCWFVQNKADVEFSLKSITQKLQQLQMKEQRSSSSSLPNSLASESGVEAEGEH